MTVDYADRVGYGYEAGLYWVFCWECEDNITETVEEFETKKLPSLQDLSPEEIKVLKFTYTKKSFNEEDVIRKGISLDAGKIIKELQKKGLIIKNGAEFSLSQNYIFSQLSKNACLYKTEVDALRNYEKKEKKIRN